RVREDDVALVAARAQGVERIAGDEREPRRPILAGHPGVLLVEHLGGLHPVPAPDAVGPLYREQRSGREVAQEREVRVAVAADHAVAALARERRAEDVPRPERDRAAVG